MFFPGKLIILKIFYCLPGGVFVVEDFFFPFSGGPVHSFAMQSMSVLPLQTPSLALLEVKEGPSVKTSQWNWQGLLAILQYLANTAGHPAIPPAAVLGYMDLHPACARTGVSASPSPVLREGCVSPRAGGFGPTMLSLYCSCWCYCSASVCSGLLKALCWNKEYFCPC